MATDLRQMSGAVVTKKMSRAHSTRRRRGQCGAMALEAGLTVVLLFALIFLVMDLSMLVFVKSTLQQATREGLRYGITAQLYGANAYLNDSIVQAVQDESLGFLSGNLGACKIQVNYYNPDTGASSTGTQGDVVVVSVNGFNYTPLGAILHSADPFSINVSSSDVMERCPETGCPDTQNPVPRTCP